jgi:tricorn protease
MRAEIRSHSGCKHGPTRLDLRLGEKMIRYIAAMGFLMLSCAARSADNPLLLLQDPTLSKTQIVFEYGGELWEVSRSGGRAHVLASGLDLLDGPIFSPDGSMVAFTGTYDSNTDVYVVPASGGEPKRLTYHPGPDIAVGWTPDGKSVLFRSKRYSYSDPDQLFTVPVTGGFPSKLPLREGETGAYSPDGSHIAYVPGFQWEPFWKGYKGGQHSEIWIARLSDASVVKVPGEDANANDPMWIDKTVYFLSDRDGPITLFAYDTDSGQIRRLIDNHGFDITSASAGPDGIAYSQFGEIHIYDVATGKTDAVPITVSGDLPQLRPRLEDVSKQIESYEISPNGVRAVFEAHGDILTVPTKDGSIVNITHSPGVMDRSPAWSPDGKSIAYFSDREGEYDLYVSPQDGIGSVRRIALGQMDAYYQPPRWSPDNEKLVFADQKLNLWYVDLKAETLKPVRVDTNADGDFEPDWSPDSRWLAYTKSMPNNLHAVFVYSLADGHAHQMTDGASDCLHAAFDPKGKYLYFTSNTDALSVDQELDTLEHPLSVHVYSLALQAGTTSPVAPKAGFETGAAASNESTPPSEAKGASDAPEGSEKSSPRKAASSKSPPQAAIPKVAIDFGGIGSRLVALPIKPANYVGLAAGAAGKSGTLYLIEAPLVFMPEDRGPNGVAVSVLSFDLDSIKMETLQTGATKVALSASRKQLLFQRGPDWFIADAQPNAKPTRLDLAGMRVRIDPQQEWAEMYHDAWRIERAFFYNPTFDGLDIDAAEREFAHYLPGVASRDELTFLFREMLSYLSVGHMFIRGGYVPKMEEIHVGLLGADFDVENGRYRITRIFTGGRWNPQIYAPLAQPGLDVRAGDYLLAVNGNPLRGEENLYQAFEDLANKTVTLTVSANPDMKAAREITVKTVRSEAELRNAAWIEHNADVVDRLSGGRLAYVYLPDTQVGGFTNFNRYFFSQVDKQGVIIDERFNHGGDLPDYFIHALQVEPVSLLVERWGTRPTQSYPLQALYGPKVMIVNQYAGSGGDALPWYFKMAKVGPLVGERTWGGLVGIGGYPELMDGGSVTAPRTAVEALNGTFPVENYGVEPDVTVWQDPALVREGHDPQLERAVSIALEQLREHPPVRYEPAPWRDYHPHLPPLPGGN